MYRSSHNQKLSKTTITYSELPAITDVTTTNYVLKNLHQQHFLNTPANPHGRHISNYIHYNEVNIANETSQFNNRLWKVNVESIN